MPNNALGPVIPNTAKEPKIIVVNTIPLKIAFSDFILINFAHLILDIFGYCFYYTLDLGPGTYFRNFV